MLKPIMLWLVAVGAVAVCSCDRKDSATAKGAPNMPATQTRTITITSGAFAGGARIPQRHTGQGENLSPPLQWSGVPAGAQQLVLIVDDPDAPREVFTHWVMYDIPAATTSLKEGISPSPQVGDPQGARQGKNSYGDIGYKGPMPPRGSVHHYRFHLYALDVDPHLKPGMTKQQVLAMIQGHILAEGELVGTYERQ